MIAGKVSRVQMVAPKGDHELATKTRLKILLQLALSIGRREGILGNNEQKEAQDDKQGTNQ